MNLILLKQSEIQSSSSSSSSNKEQQLQKQTSLHRNNVVDIPSNDERAKHIINHLHKESGELVSVGVIGGSKGKAVVVRQNNGCVRLEMQSDTFLFAGAPSPSSKPPNVDEEEPEITLILAVPFPMRIKALWPIISSFHAVTRIVIVKSQLSNPEFNATRNLLPEVYNPLIEKGMMQGGRTRQVKVDVCVCGDDHLVSRQLLDRLGLLCKSSFGGGDDDDNNNSGDAHHHDGVARVFLDCGDGESSTAAAAPSSSPRPVRDVVLDHCCRGKQNTTTTAAAMAAPSAIIAVGPERGWTSDEASLFVNECGFESATLGNSILRVDTAVVASLGIVSAALDELVSMRKKNDDKEEEDGDTKRQRRSR
jgi:16S rRNA U1498 N3-methylase RsmE